MKGPNIRRMGIGRAKPKMRGWRNRSRNTAEAQYLKRFANRRFRQRCKAALKQGEEVMPQVASETWWW